MKILRTANLGPIAMVLIKKGHEKIWTNWLISPVRNNWLMSTLRKLIG